MIGLLGNFDDDAQYFMRDKDFNRLVWHGRSVHTVELMGTGSCNQYSVIKLSDEAFDSIAAMPSAGPHFYNDAGCAHLPDDPEVSEVSAVSAVEISSRMCDMAEVVVFSFDPPRPPPSPPPSAAALASRATRPSRIRISTTPLLTAYEKRRVTHHEPSAQAFFREDFTERSEYGVGKSAKAVEAALRLR